jgi:hypothetical protein
VGGTSSSPSIEGEDKAWLEDAGELTEASVERDVVEERELMRCRPLDADCEAAILDEEPSVAEVSAEELFRTRDEALESGCLDEALELGWLTPTTLLFLLELRLDSPPRPVPSPLLNDAGGARLESLLRPILLRLLLLLFSWARAAETSGGENVTARENVKQR